MSRFSQWLDKAVSRSLRSLSRMNRAFRAKFPRLAKWMPFSDSLQHTYETKALFTLKNQRRNELAKASPTADQTSTKHIISACIAKKQTFAQTAPKALPFAKLPAVFERYGSKNEITAYSRLANNMPANYKNLCTVVAENAKQIIKARAKIANNSPRLQASSPREDFIYPPEGFMVPLLFVGATNFFATSSPTMVIVNDNDYCKAQVTNASQEIDGANTAISYAKRGLDWLSKSAPCVKFNEGHRPSWQTGIKEPQEKYISGRNFGL